MNNQDLLVGTRPPITDGRIIMTGSDGFDGYEIMEYLGMAWGISVRAKDIGQDCGMVCRQVTGGEMTSYTQLGDESRQMAIDRLLQMAADLRANGVINVRFELSGAAHGASLVVAHGTAVKIEPVKNYVPTGAAGNILAELVHVLAEKQDAHLPDDAPVESDSGDNDEAEDCGA